jgi:V8-like Glu-specific endopeptidase
MLLSQQCTVASEETKPNAELEIDLKFADLSRADQREHDEVLSVAKGTSTGRLFFNATQFPFSGGLLRGDRTCTGSLIAAKVFLTAAHCVCETVDGVPQYYSADAEKILHREVPCRQEDVPGAGRSSGLNT